jgi:hypothetical protein
VFHITKKCSSDTVWNPITKSCQKDKRPSRYYRDREYIGIKGWSQDWRGAYNPQTSIKKFRGHPDNRYDYVVIIDYKPEYWHELISTIKKEAEEEGRDVIIDPEYAYPIPRWTHTPKK